MMGETLSNLKPRWSTVWENRTPETGGIGDTGNTDLIFLCPACLKLHEICIRVGPVVATHPIRIWAAIPPKPTNEHWVDHLTISPSIDNTGKIYRGTTCNFHANLIDGVFQP